MKSIRQTISRSVGLALGTALALSLGLLGWVVGERVKTDFDRALAERASVMAGLISVEGGYLEIDFEDLAESEATEGERYRILVQGRGEVARSRGLGKGIAWDRRLEENPFENAFLDTRVEGVPWRTRVFAFVPRIDDEEDGEASAHAESGAGELPLVAVHLARATAERDRFLRFLYLSLATVGIVAAVGCMAIVWQMVPHGLKPLGSINRQLQRIDPAQAGSGVKLDDPPAELVPILAALNDYLARSGEAVMRERRFSGAAAHELRTPVAELRMACEAGLKWPEDAESAAAFFRHNHEIALQMERIVGHLLQLSRCESGARPVEREPCRLDELARNCLAHCQVKADRRGMRMRLKGEVGAEVKSDRGKLEIILQNLLENALAYGEAGSEVLVTVSKMDEGWRLAVENDTQALQEKDLELMFDRFWRKDAARSGGSHAGLGLSLVKALAEALGLEVQASLVGRRLRMALLFA